MEYSLHSRELDTIFHPCRQCGVCCRTYPKVLLQEDEIDFIRKMGGHVGVDVALNDLRTHTMEELVEQARDTGKVYMVHPDEHGCVFLEKRNEKYYCRIYPHRPRACKGFRCTLADSSILDLLGGDAIYMLGCDRFGLLLDTDL